MRALNRLSPAEVKHAKPKPGSKGTTLLADGGGLYLSLIGDARSWVFRWIVNGQERKMGLGSVEAVGIAEARRKAAECRRLRSQGLDPIDHRETQKAAAALEAAKALTFDQASAQYIAAHRAGWKNEKHAAQWPSTLKTWCSPVFGHLPVQAVDVQLVLKALAQPVEDDEGEELPFWLARAETARRTRGRIEAVLGWAKAQGLRSGDNPAAWETLQHLLPDKSDVAAVRHHPAMDYRDVPAFMADLRKRNSVSARALEFTILSCLRTSEVILTPRDGEMDMAELVWVIPPARMKGRRKRKREHRVPLTPRLVEIIEEMQALGSEGYLFPGDQLDEPLSNMAMLELLRGFNLTDKDGQALTVHGFRSSFKDWAIERTSFPDFVSEVAQAHVSADKVRKAYARSDLVDLRRKLAEAWEAWCGGRDNVRELRPAAA
jgi:integrase